MPRTLIIEDSPTQAEQLRLILEAEGFTVTTAPDGERGLDLLRESAFDLVLSDVLMPGLSGYEVCRRIKTEPATRDMPVVLLTVLNDPLDILQGLECGADNFITKPYESHFLIQRLQNILANQMRRGPQELRTRVELSFRGTGVTVTSDKEQILDLLIATLEEFVRTKEKAHEMRVAKEGMEKSQRLIQSALDALSAYIAVLDEGGTVLAVNAAWRCAPGGNPLFGPGCGVGANYLVACEASGGEGAGQGPVVASAIRAILGAQENECTREFPWDGPQGKQWFGVRVTRLEDNPPIRVVVAYEDLTGRKGLEEELRQRAQDLVEANQRKDHFLSMLAHELRNPLAPVLTGLRLLEEPDADSAAKKQALDTVGRQVRHLSRLLDQLLDVSRITHGKVRLHPERLDLARMVRTTAEDRRPTMEQGGLSLAVQAPETPVWVMGDATRLAQVLNNLLENGAKFTDQGGGVAIRLTADRDQGLALVSIRDTGIGIDPELLPWLFDVFAQGDRSLARTRGGLGLGLAVAKGLVDLHGGDIQVASAGPGRGAEFTVRLPLEPEPVALAELPAAPRRAGEQRKVLIVEDNQDAADMLRLWLELIGHQATVAYTGPEGVKAAREWRPDVVLCDIGLPGMDGYGVAVELRQHPPTAQIRLIAVTGYGQEEDRRRSLKAGFDSHLVKPVDPEELQRLLASWEGRRGNG